MANAWRCASSIIPQVEPKRFSKNCCQNAAGPGQAKYVQVRAGTSAGRLPVQDQPETVRFSIIDRWRNRRPGRFRALGLLAEGPVGGPPGKKGFFCLLYFPRPPVQPASVHPLPVDPAHASGSQIQKGYQSGNNAAPGHIPEVAQITAEYRRLNHVRARNLEVAQRKRAYRARYLRCPWQGVYCLGLEQDSRCCYVSSVNRMRRFSKLTCACRARTPPACVGDYPITILGATK